MIYKGNQGQKNFYKTQIQQMENTTKLHFSNDPTIRYRYNKIKSVINALGCKVLEEPKDLFTDLKHLCPIPTLPVLETPEGSFSSSNTIIRYLASVNENKLYGANEYERALVDQWLDLTTCDFDICCFGVHIISQGREVDIEKLTQDAQKYLAVLNKHVKNRKFIVGEGLTIADLALACVVGPVINMMYGENERKRYGPLVAWYQGIAEKNKNIEPQVLSKVCHKKFDKTKKQKGGEKGGDKGKEEKAEKGKKQKKDKKGDAPKKEEAKPAEPKKQEQDDLFADDDDAGKPAPAKPAQPAKPKAAKPKPVAKSIVVFDVKVYEQDQDLLALCQKIKDSFVLDGLVWNNEPKILPIAFGMNKLQMGCVIEDAKISIEQSVFEKLLEWEEEIQSVDTVSFQKL